MPTKQKKNTTANDLVKYIMEGLEKKSMAEAQRSAEKRIDAWKEGGWFYLAKSPNETWIKVIIRLQLDLEHYKDTARAVVLLFECACDTRHMYYARYTSLDSSTIEISALTGVSSTCITRFLLQVKGVENVDVQDRGTGSLAHAHAFQAVKHLEPFNQDLAEDNAFLDVLHWMCNQRGLDYLREARLFAFRTLCLTHSTAIESTRNMETMRKFNAKTRLAQAVDGLAERLKLNGGKVQARDNQAASKLARKLKPKRSAGAVEHKASSSRGRRSAGPAPR